MTAPYNIIDTTIIILSIVKIFAQIKWIIF